MAQQKFGTANNFSLSGGSIENSIAVQSFDGISIEVAVTNNSAGNTGKGVSVQQPRPGAKTYGQPVFTCPISKGNKKLWNWWKLFYPAEGQQGSYEPEEITFSFKGEEGNVLAEWQLKNAFPMKYEISSGNVDESSLAAETITLCCSDIVRRE
jgi:phage tail-like protein